MVHYFDEPIKIHDGRDFVVTFQNSNDINDWLASQHQWLDLVDSLGHQIRKEISPSIISPLRRQIQQFHDEVAEAYKIIEDPKRPVSVKEQTANMLGEKLSEAYQAAANLPRDRLLPLKFIPWENGLGQVFVELRKSSPFHEIIVDDLPEDRATRALEIAVSLCLLYGVPLRESVPPQHMYRAIVDLLSIRLLPGLAERAIENHWKRAEESALEKQTAHLNTLGELSTATLQTLQNEIEENKKDIEEKREEILTDISSNAKSHLALMSGEKEKKKLEWLKELWEKRKRNQSIAAFFMDLAFVGVLGFTMIAIAMYYQELSGIIVSYAPDADGQLSPTDDVNWGKLAPIAAVAFGLVWLLRMLRQNALDLRAKAHTASTKVAMFKSYFRLVSDADTSPTPEERVLITEALFRDTEHTSTHDDGMPNTIATAIIDRLMRK